MGFKLNIECSKDIDELHINFSDGSTSVIESPNKPKAGRPEGSKNTPKDESKINHGIELDLDTDYEVSQKVVEKPPVPELNREVKVSQDMVKATY